MIMQLSCMFNHTSPLAHPAALITCRQCENLTVHLAAGLLHHIFIIIFHGHNKKHKDKQNYLYKNVCFCIWFSPVFGAHTHSPNKTIKNTRKSISYQKCNVNAAI